MDKNRQYETTERLNMSPIDAVYAWGTVVISRRRLARSLYCVSLGVVLELTNNYTRTVHPLRQRKRQPCIWRFAATSQSREAS
jgi:hypothetical protein